MSDLLERIKRCAMPHGAPSCKGTWLRQEGEMRFAPDKPWLPFEAEQWFPGNAIEFRWQARVRMAPFLRARVIDAFEGGKGLLTAHVCGFIRVAHAEGPETDLAEALRGLAELPWRPYAFATAPHLRFEELGDSKLRATYDDGRTGASVEFDVDREGHILGGSAASRPRMVGKTLVETPWSGSYGEYREFDGIRVPTTAEASWDLPEGKFTYWRGRVMEFRIMR